MKKMWMIVGVFVLGVGMVACTSSNSNVKKNSGSSSQPASNSSSSQPTSRRSSLPRKAVDGRKVAQK